MHRLPPAGIAEVMSGLNVGRSEPAVHVGQEVVRQEGIRQEVVRSAVRHHSISFLLPWC
jgi:hypothetical protein